MTRAMTMKSLPWHLRLAYPLFRILIPKEDGDSLTSYPDPARDYEELKRHSARDAEAMPRFTETMYKMAFAVKPILGYVHPTPAAPACATCARCASWDAT